MSDSSRQQRAKSQPRRGLRRGEAATYIGLSPSMFDMMVADGRLPKPIKFGAASVWDMLQLDEAFGDPSTSANDNPYD